MTNKIFTSFKDKFGNEYNFANYQEFSRFWFNQKFQTLQDYFPDFRKLQNYACNSKEARKPAY